MSKYLTNVGYLEDDDVDVNNGNPELKMKKDAIVFLQASWCGYCQKMKPIFQEFANEMKNNGKIACLTVQSDIKEPGTESMQAVAKKFKSNGFPSWFLFKNGKMVKQESGYMPMDQLKKLVGL